MAMLKKSLKSKFVSEDINDFLNESQFIKDSPKTKKPQKRQRNENTEAFASKTTGQHTTSAKSKKIDGSFEVCRASRQKLFEVMSGQLETRKHTNDNLLKSLSEVLTSLEADYNMLKDNEQKLEHLTGAFMKCIQQTTASHKQKLKALKEIHASFEKEAEGLVKRGAIKPDDRPLWFDVYKAFPPITEPKFARPKVENKFIRPILYKEDVVRAKFNAQGHGFAAINMFNQSGDTQIKKLLQEFDKLIKEGIPENEAIEKSAALVSSERQESQKIAPSPKEPQSVSSHVLEGTDLKNIFKE